MCALQFELEPPFIQETFELSAAESGIVVGKYLLLLPVVGFRSLVEEESTYWTLVNSPNLQNELMDVHQSDISKMLRFSTSNLVSFMFYVRLFLLISACW